MIGVFEGGNIMEEASVSGELLPEQQERLDALLVEIRDIRPLPAIAARVLSMSEGEQFSAQHLAELIRVDQALSVRLLRLANSPVYGMPRRVTTLRDAVVLLGFRELRSLAVASCVADASIVTKPDFDYPAFWKASFAVASFAAALAELLDCEKDEAFMAGVVHNVGRLAWAQFRPSWLQLAMGVARRSGQGLHEVQRELFGFSDAETGGFIARQWQFPEALCEAVSTHDGPRSGDDPAGMRLATVVRRAARFAHANRINDGMDPDSRAGVEQDWSHPRVRNALQAAGGVAGILKRADEFVTASGLVVPAG